MTKNKKITSKRGSENERKKWFGALKKRIVAQHSKTESLKYAQDFHQIHLKVLRKHALRKRPQTCLPARVQREGPKWPGSRNSIISLYRQHFSPNSGPKKGSPREAPGGPGRDPLVPKWGSERDSVFWCSIWSIYLFFDEIFNITGDQWKTTNFWRYKYSKNVMFIERKSWFSWYLLGLCVKIYFYPL